jgi:hypothetical protein
MACYECFFHDVGCEAEVHLGRWEDTGKVIGSGAQKEVLLVENSKTGEQGALSVCGRRVEFDAIMAASNTGIGPTAFHMAACGADPKLLPLMEGCCEFHMHVVSEYCPKGDLLTTAPRPEEMATCLELYWRMAALGFYQNDLKLANVLRNDHGGLYLIDYGLATDRMMDGGGTLDGHMRNRAVTLMDSFFGCDDAMGGDLERPAWLDGIAREDKYELVLACYQEIVKWFWRKGFDCHGVIDERALGSALRADFGRSSPVAARWYNRIKIGYINV